MQQFEHDFDTYLLFNLRMNKRWDNQFEGLFKELWENSISILCFKPIRMQQNVENIKEEFSQRSIFANLSSRTLKGDTTFNNS